MSVSTDCSIATAPVHGVVVFEPAAFKLAYPMFAAVADAMLQLFFGLATLIVGNTCSSTVANATQRERLLNLLVAHIATLSPTTGGAGSGSAMVGHITEASEGTVRVSAEYASTVSQNAAWFLQTQWGALFWQLTAPYRSMRYVTPTQCCGPAGYLSGRMG